MLLLIQQLIKKQTNCSELQIRGLNGLNSHLAASASCKFLLRFCFGYSPFAALYFAEHCSCSGFRFDAVPVTGSSCFPVGSDEPSEKCDFH